MGTNEMDISVQGDSNTGLVRKHNEDSYLCLDLSGDEVGIDAVMVVADGMGGHAAGEVASAIAINRIKQRCESSYFVAEDILWAMSKLLSEVNQEVIKEGEDPNNRGMGTTCTLVVINDSQLYYAHVGDSRAYLFHNDGLTQITTDHSWVEEAVKMGLIPREKAREHPNRNIITRAIGLEPDVKVDIGQLELSGGETVLLCSDGLNSMLTDGEIKMVLSEGSMDTVCSRLIQEANNAGGEDNTTVVIATYGPR